jgi:S1-C subfamily serine protease
VVVPGPTRTVVENLKPPADEPETQEFADVAQIQSIIASSQAETLGLLEGDIIIEYDGVPITSARQLVAEVEKKAGRDRVEMVIVREKTPQRLTLSSGFIGIRIKTTKIPKEEFNTYYLSE